MFDEPSLTMAIIRRGVGLGGALALLAACGPGSPIADHGELGSEASSDESSGNGMPALQCTVENYADHPGLLERTDVGCVWMGDEPTCPVCDTECADLIMSCSCSDYTVLCTERVEDYCCHLITANEEGLTFIPGRPLRDRGVPVLPEVSYSSSDSSPFGVAYRELARHERASVDAFTACAAILDRLHAPSALIERNHVAALEEAEHARLALRAAEAIDGCAATLSAMPSSTADFDLGAFVRDLITDGCIGEASAAREAEWALARPGVLERPALRRFWQRVAIDEAGHAALAWSTLEFLIATHRELEAIIQSELRRVMRAPTGLAVLADAEAAERMGIASPQTKASLRAQVIADLLAAAEARAAA